MPSEEIRSIHIAIESLRQSNDSQFKALNEKVDPMFEAFTTMKQSSGWLKYLLGIGGAFVALVLAIKELFKHQ